MESIQYIQTLLSLTSKKQEALTYLCDFLEKIIDEGNNDYITQYFNQKQKIEKAILKVDIEFLNSYHGLLEAENVNSIGELSKEKFTNIKELQGRIANIKELEEKIVLLEERLFSKKTSVSKPLDRNGMKRVDTRVINAYKKNKKE